MNKIKKIAIFTGNRAEFGLLSPIIRSLIDVKKFDVKIIASGSHLEKNYGSTIKEIKENGFKIYSQIKLNYPKDKKNTTSLAISDGAKQISKVLFKLKPDLFIVYADSVEGFAAVIASTQMNIVTAHIEGGDLTQGGALDDSVRHAMSKLSHIHFTSNKSAKDRLIKLGEEKWRVFNVGFAAIDLFKKNTYASSNEIIKKFKIDISKPIILFTQHPITTNYTESEKEISPSLKALNKIAKLNYNIIITYPNNDIGSLKIINKIKKIKNRKIKIYNSIGSFYYHGILNLNKLKIQKVVCVGNSSSGIKETPYFKCPTVNIGTRQDGRLRANNVIDVNYNANEIYLAIIRSINDVSFQDKINKTHNPYDGGNTGKNIANILKKLNFDIKKILNKQMTY